MSRVRLVQLMLLRACLLIWHLDGRMLDVGLCDVCNLRMAVMEKFCFYYHFELGWELYEKRNRGGFLKYTMGVLA